MVLQFKKGIWLGAHGGRIRVSWKSLDLDRSEMFGEHLGHKQLGLIFIVRHGAPEFSALGLGIIWHLHICSCIRLLSHQMFTECFYVPDTRDMSSKKA